nr:MAG TPA: hypothetical protein [Caudoviricetes sp.]
MSFRLKSPVLNRIEIRRVFGLSYINPIYS